MSPINRHTPPTSAIPSSLNLAQIITLFVEIRDLAHQLIDQQRQLAELLRSRPAERDDELDMLTVADTAATLSYNRRTIYRLIQEGELNAVGSGPRLRIPRASVRQYIQRHRDQ